MERATLVGSAIIFKGRPIEVSGHVRDSKSSLLIVKDEKALPPKVGDNVLYISSGTTHKLISITKNGWYYLSENEHIGVRLSDIKSIGSNIVSYYRMPRNTELIDYCKKLSKNFFSYMLNYNKIKLALALMRTQA